jgi:hypothetical protein
MVEKFVADNASGLVHMSPLEIRTTLALIIDGGLEDTLKNYINKLHSARALSTELMSIALRLTYRKGCTSLAQYVLRETMSLGYATNIEGVNSVLELLNNSNQFRPILSIVQDMQKGLYGSVTCDSTSLGYLFHAGCRQQSTQALLHCCQFALKLHSTRKLKSDERIYMDALHMCMLKGDVSGAMVVFSLYQKVHNPVQSKAYELVLSTYLSAVTTGTAVTAKSAAAIGGGASAVSHANIMDNSVTTHNVEQAGPVTTTRLVDERLRHLVQHIITAGLDRAEPTLAELVWRYLRVQSGHTAHTAEITMRDDSHRATLVDDTHGNANTENSTSQRSWRKSADRRDMRSATPTSPQVSPGPTLPSAEEYHRRALESMNGLGSEKRSC